MKKPTCLFCYGRWAFFFIIEMLILMTLPEEDPVFSHGDYCLPNLFLKEGKVSGYMDLGRSGIADRYQDIALCYRSLKHNYSGRYGGKVYTQLNPDFRPESLFEELGIEPDWEKIRYYILLDELF